MAYTVDLSSSEVRCDTAEEVRGLLNGKSHKRAASNGDGAHEVEPQRRKRRKTRKPKEESPETTGGEPTGEETTTGTGDANPEVPYTTKPLSWKNVGKIGKKIGWTGTPKELMRKLQERKAAGK
jgi:hypothetical protein